MVTKVSLRENLDIYFEAKSNFFHLNTTGLEFISATPFNILFRNSSTELTLMCIKKVRAILPNNTSTRLSHEPCFCV